jgi:hypothetical protein
LPSTEVTVTLRTAEGGTLCNRKGETVAKKKAGKKKAAKKKGGKKKTAKKKGGKKKARSAGRKASSEEE